MVGRLPPFGLWPIFRGELLVSGRVFFLKIRWSNDRQTFSQETTSLAFTDLNSQIGPYICHLNCHERFISGGCRGSNAVTSCCMPFRLNLCFARAVTCIISSWNLRNRFFLVKTNTKIPRCWKDSIKDLSSQINFSFIALLHSTKHVQNPSMNPPACLFCGKIPKITEMLLVP